MVPLEGPQILPRGFGALCFQNFQRSAKLSRLDRLIGQIDLCRIEAAACEQLLLRRKTLLLVRLVRAFASELLVMFRGDPGLLRLLAKPALLVFCARRANRLPGADHCPKYKQRG